jgi:hypothetical protein
LDAGESGVVGSEDVVVSPGALLAMAAEAGPIAYTEDAASRVGACALRVAAASAAGVFATRGDDATLTTFGMLDEAVTMFDGNVATFDCAMLGMFDGVEEIFVTLGEPGEA